MTARKTPLSKDTILTRQDVDLSSNGMHLTCETAGLLVMK